VCDRLWNLYWWIGYCCNYFCGSVYVNVVLGSVVWNDVLKYVMEGMLGRMFCIVLMFFRVVGWCSGVSLMR